MRVVVEIISGPLAGKKFRLEGGQVLQVGRTEWADYAIAGDGQMSSVHFALETDHENCYVKDLGSTNGTFLNQQRVVARTAVHNGDQVLAGQTSFAVRIEATSDGFRSPVRDSSSGQVASPPPPEPGLAVTAPLPATGSSVARCSGRFGDVPQSPEPVSAPLKKATFTAEPCDSGLTLYRGSVDEIAPADLAVLLCHVYPAYLMVDFRNLGCPRPTSLVAPSYLFDWLEPMVADLVSPVIIGQEDLLSWPKLIEEGWGNDAVVCLFSRDDKPTLVEHLRHALRKNPAGAPEEGILGLCWPSVLAPVLAHFPTASVAQLLTGISAVLLEFADLPESWQIYGSSEIGRHLEQLGLKQTAGNPEEKS